MSAEIIGPAAGCSSLPTSQGPSSDMLVTVSKTGRPHCVSFSAKGPLVLRGIKAQELRRMGHDMRLGHSDRIGIVGGNHGTDDKAKTKAPAQRKAVDPQPGAGVREVRLFDRTKPAPTGGRAMRSSRRGNAEPRPKSTAADFG